MDPDEKNQRVLYMNAHFKWAMALWASADVAYLRNNYRLAPQVAGGASERLMLSIGVACQSID